MVRFAFRSALRALALIVASAIAWMPPAQGVLANCKLPFSPRYQGEELLPEIVCCNSDCSTYGRNNDPNIQPGCTTPYTPPAGEECPPGFACLAGKIEWSGFPGSGDPTTTPPVLYDRCDPVDGDGRHCAPKGVYKTTFGAICTWRWEMPLPVGPHQWILHCDYYQIGQPQPVILFIDAGECRVP